MQTRHKFGRTTGDKRSAIQSIVLASLPSPCHQGSKPSDRTVAGALGLSFTRYRRIVMAVIDKRASLESTVDDKETVYSEILKSKGKIKAYPTLQKTDWFIHGHPFKVASPIRNNSALVRDPLDPTKKQEGEEYCKVFEGITNDLLKEVPECCVDGNMLVSDWKLRKLLPPEVWQMSNYYKTQCACIVCVWMKLYHTNNSLKAKLLQQLKQEVDGLTLGSRIQELPWISITNTKRNPMYQT